MKFSDSLVTVSDNDFVDEWVLRQASSLKVELAETLVETLVISASELLSSFLFLLDLVLQLLHVQVKSINFVRPLHQHFAFKLHSLLCFLGLKFLSKLFVNNLAPTVEHESLSATVQLVPDESLNSLLSLVALGVVSPRTNHDAEASSVLLILVKLGQAALLLFFRLFQFFDVILLVFDRLQHFTDLVVSSA